MSMSQTSNHNRASNIYETAGNGDYDYATAADFPVYDNAVPVTTAPSGGHVVTPSGEVYATVSKTRNMGNQESTDAELVENSVYDMS